MNDRLADVGGEEIPSWAIDNGDVEVGVSTPPVHSPQSANPFGDDDDGEDFAWANSDENDENINGSEEKNYMDGFFKDIESIREDIESIVAATKRIAEMNDEAIVSISEVRENELSLELTPLVQETNKRAKRTKGMLELLKEENEKFKLEKTVKDADMRIRENLCNTLLRKFIDEMKLYQNAQQKYKADLQNKAERQIKILKPDATREEVDTLMKSDIGRNEQVTTYFLEGGVNDSIKQAYTKVAGKYQDVLALEQSVAELHQMFLDFALLTMQQGELLDQIEYNVKGAADYVEDGNVDVHRAIEYQKSIRKKQCWILLIVVVVLAIIFLMVFKPWSN